MADRSVVVRLIADTGSYEQGMRRAASATGSLEGAGRSTIVTLGSLRGLLGTLTGVEVAKTGIEFDALKQRSQAAFSTILGDSGKARVELKQLYDEFKANPFGYPQILKSSQQLLAMGVNGRDLVRTVRDISDATAAVGGSAEVFDRVSLAIGQMRAKGTIQAEEMRQLAEAGIPAWQALAHEIGVSVPEAMKMVQRREVDSQQGLDALLRGIEGRFGGATKTLENTWTGTLQAFKAEATQVAGEIAQPLVRVGTDAMHALDPLLHQIGSLASAFSSLSTPMQNTILTLGVVMLASGRLNGAWRTGTLSMRAFGDEMRLQQALATMSGTSLSRLGAVATVTGIRMRALGASMLSAFGGPIGVAIIAATFGLSWYAEQQAKAKAAAEAHAAAVQTLRDNLDRLTLSLTAAGQASIDQSLATDKIGATGKTVVDTLHQLGLNAVEFRNAISQGADSTSFRAVNDQLLYQGSLIVANTAALSKFAADEKVQYPTVVRALLTHQGKVWADLKNVLANEPLSGARGSLEALREVYELLNQKTGDLKQSQKELADAMALSVPDAAKAAGVSADVVAGAFDRWREKGGSLRDALVSTGLTASQVDTIIRVLSGDAMNAAYSFGGAASALKSLQDGLAGAASGFVSVTGAWDTAKQSLQASMQGGGGGGASASPEQDPAVKAARAAIAAFKDQRFWVDAALNKKLQEAKAFEASEKKKADAADASAARAKKAWDTAKAAADAADKSLADAKDRKAQADRDAHDAAAILAEVTNDSALNAGGPDSAAWAAAVAKASTASTSAAAVQAGEAAKLAAAQSKVGGTHAASTQAQSAYLALQQRAIAADKAETAAKAVLAAATSRLERVRAVEDAKYQKLLQAEQKAEQRAQAAASAAAGGTSGAFSQMVKDVQPSLQQYLDELHSEVTAQENWSKNMITLAGKIPPGVALELAKLGPQAAPLVQKLVNGTKAQLDEFVRDFPKSTKTGVQDIVTELSNGIPLIAAVGKVAGSKMAAQLADSIRTGKTTVSAAIKALQGTLDEKTLQMRLGLSNKAAIQWELDNLIRDHVYRFRTINYRGSPAFVVSGIAGVQTIAMATGGWVRGGDGIHDDVPVPVDRKNGLRAMGGEFMVRKDIAQRNKAFFDEMDRTGRFPRLPAFAPAGAAAGSREVVHHHVHHYEPRIYQLPGQSAAELVNEAVRLMPLADAGRTG